MKPGNTDIIIGTDVYRQLLEGFVVKGLVNVLVAQLTILGWVISSPVQIKLDNQELTSIIAMSIKNVNKIALRRNRIIIKQKCIISRQRM